MQDNVLTLGSLFDGVAGFPLAGAMCGIKTLWSSEIEPFCLKVTAARFPDVKQLGSVTEIDGGAAEPVDIISFGSPCQDLSVAGKQLGIHEGQRSNLFFEAVRIIKEMRKADEARGRTGKSIRPRFAVWENVPGAFSSNKGADFKAVLEALAGVIEADVSIPQPKRWDTGGGIVGNGWSLAWRVYDAQYWGVPQRRKRIYLVADFAGERAGEILFEREGVRGHSSQGGEAGEGTAADAERSVGGSDSVKCLNPWDCQSKRQHDVTGCYPTLQAYNGGGGRCEGVCYPAPEKIGGGVVLAAGFKGCAGAKSGSTGFGIGVSPTLTAQLQTHTVYALQGNCIDRADTAVCNGCGWREGEMYTLNTIDRPAIAFQQNQRDEVRDMGEQAGALTAQPGVHNQNYLCYPETARTLTARHDSSPCVDRGQNVVALAWANSGNAGLSEGDVAPTIKAARNGEPAVCALDCRNMTGNEELSGTLQAKNEGGFSLNFVNPVVYENSTGDGISPTITASYYKGPGTRNGEERELIAEESAQPPRKYIVRRLTPTECARLQGFPDEWCEGLGGSDSAIYKAYGNGLALPCAYDVMNRIARFVEHEKEDQQ